MPVRFNHMMIAARDRHASAAFFAEMFGLPAPDDSRMFSVVRLADEEMLLFAEPGIDFPGQHYAFLIDDETFDGLLSRLQERAIAYQGDPRGRLPNQINTNHGGRGVYFDDPSGHHLEALTRPYGVPGPPIDDAIGVGAGLFDHPV
jgi:catechol 2,3-dioxygenase-like lactoylglutathione lyase family enzyme